MPMLGTYVPPGGKPGKFIERCGCGCGVIALVLLLILVLLVAMLAAAILGSFGAGALSIAPTLSVGAGLIGLFVLLVVAGILLTIAGLLLAWILFRWLVRTLFGPVLTPMIASLRELARIIRAIADGVHGFAGGIDQAATTLGGVSVSIPSIPATTDLWTLLLSALGLAP